MVGVKQDLETEGKLGIGFLNPWSKCGLKIKIFEEQIRSASNCQGYIYYHIYMIYIYNNNIIEERADRDRRFNMFSKRGKQCSFLHSFSVLYMNDLSKRNHLTHCA